MSRPSVVQQAGVGAVLLLVDLMVIAWLLYGYGMTGWADSYDASPSPDAASRAARQAMWFLAGGAVVTGGGLLALGWRISGMMQFLLLGGAAGVFALFASP
ncbi:hypothetical protein ACIF80_09360 [Streptomyces sp. NPDC085927]|uniref:hypothetical protein n=1 Tax=Streptomyces sp. NPDC085927 TaxID=3365738 RepID=UPI0037D37CCE